MIKILIVPLLLTVPLFFFLTYKNQTLIVKPTTVLNQNLSTPSTNIEPQFNAVMPSLDQIFSQDHTFTATLPNGRKRVLIATGDVIPARVVNIQAIKFKNFNWSYEKVANVLRNSDITFINLETPLIKNCPLVNDGFKFCGSDKNVEGLVFSGIDVASLANNHAGNYGLEAITYTANLLKSSDILVTGQNGPVYKDVRGLVFAFLGYNDIGYKQQGISWADEAKIQTEIAEARKKSDVVIVTFHWGIEYQSQPSERQKFLGHLAIDSGTDLVIGNHPHWVQPIEIYKDKLITYAHGNFVFDQEWSLKTKQGVVGRYTFFDNQLVDVEFLPIQIMNYGQPHFIDNLTEKQKIIGEMFDESSKLTSRTKVTQKQ